MAIRHTTLNKEPYKDEETLIIIAFEGEVTERIYMDLLHYKRDELSVKRNLRFQIVDTDNNHPKNIIKELIDGVDLIEGDKVFIFIDVDKHFKNQEKYNECISEYTTNNVEPIVSNRCFELLLLLHVVDLEGDDLIINQIKKYSEENKLLELLREKVEENNLNWVNVKKRFDNVMCERAQTFYGLFHRNINTLLSNLNYIERRKLLSFELDDLYNDVGTNALYFYSEVIE